MSLGLLLEKYDVSTEEGLQKALTEIEKEEAEVDEALSGVLTRACSLEGRLRTASQAYMRLGEVKADAQMAADMVDKTAVLARDVSAKVRQLDLARSRVAECQRRVHDLIDLQLCSAGVEAAIKAHDYETGAGHVARFLSMDPGSLAAARARGAPGAPDPRAAMMRAAHTLREHLVRKFEEAARREDEPGVERLFKLFPQIGRAAEGVDLLAAYLAAKTEGAVRRAGAVGDARAEGAVFADALTRVLEAGGAAVERARGAGLAAPGLLPRALRLIQPPVCAGARRVYGELVRARRLGAGAGGAGAAGALAAEPVLAELALAVSRIQLYFTFLRRKVEADASPLPDDAKKAAADAVEKIIGECELMRTGQELLAHYLELERYFLEESVGKALKLAAPQPGATSSTLVDDVFFIARKVIRRSISTGSVDGACAVLNEVAAALERDVCAALRRWLRAAPAAGPAAPPLALPPPGPAAPLADLAARLDRDLDAQRMLFLAHLSEAEAGAEWAERLAADACADAEPLLREEASRGKLQSCAAGLGAAAAGLRGARDAARAALLAALNPRLVAWGAALADPGQYPDEMEEDADALPAALDHFVEQARPHVSAGTLDALLAALLADVAARAGRRLLHHHYDRAGGLAVERRARRLAAWARGAAPGAGGAVARLVAAGALLALERVEHARDALPAAPSPARLSAAEVKDILARRTDFKIEDIKRLKL